MAERRYAEVVTAVADFEISDSERAAADFDQLEKIKRDAGQWESIAAAQAEMAAGHNAEAIQNLQELLARKDLSPEVRPEAERQMAAWGR